MSKLLKPSSIMTLIAGLLSCAAGILFQVVGGYFGQMHYNYYNPVVAIALMGTVVLAVILMLCKLYGLAALVTTVTPGLSFCAFFIGFGKRAAYWHIADVFMGIDESAFDPNYLAFCGLMIAAFIIGEIAIYMRKPGQVKV